MVAPRAFPNWVGLGISSLNARLIHFFRIFLHPRDISFELLRKSTSYFGYNPRRCFDASCSAARLEDNKRMVLRQIRSIAQSTDRILQMLIPYKLNADGLSFTIFQISPADESRYLVTCDCDAASQWFLIPYWTFAKLGKLMRLLYSTADFQGFLRQHRSGVICSKGR
jgi:hypothetical protein